VIPPALAAIPSTGGSGMVSRVFVVASTGPRSSTFSCIRDAAVGERETGGRLRRGAVFDRRDLAGTGGGANRSRPRWVIQNHTRRSLQDKFLGRNKGQPDDPLVAKVVAALRSEPAFLQIQQTIEA
jgi:hypothetical protein